MKRYIQEAICFFDKDVSTEVSSPPNKKLYGVDPYSPTLPEKQAEYFRSIVANIYGQLNKHNQVLKLQLLYFVIELSHQHNETKIKSRDCYSS